MKNKLSQLDRIENILKNEGKVSRNRCLTEYISRLSAHIGDLEKRGWKFTADYTKTPHGKDYEYTAIDSPFKRVVYTLPDGRQIHKWESK